MVEIVWVDSTTLPSRWSDEKTAESQTTKKLDLTCTTVGYLFRETGDRVVVASSISANTKQICLAVAIPKSAILSITLLEKGAAYKRRRKS